MKTLFILLLLTALSNARRNSYKNHYKSSKVCRNAQKYGTDKDTLKQLGKLNKGRGNVLEVTVSSGVKITSAGNVVPTELVSFIIYD